MKCRGGGERCGKYLSPKGVERLGMTIALIAIAILVGGWGMGLAPLRSLHPHWETDAMTAVSLVFVGSLVFLIGWGALRPSWNHFWRPCKWALSSLLLALHCSVFLEFFWKAAHVFLLAPFQLVEAAPPSALGNPAMATSVAFFSMAMCVWDDPPSRDRTLFSFLAATIALTALLGHLLGVPVLYLYVEAHSAPVAPHVAILLLVAAWGFLSMNHFWREHRNAPI